MPDGMTHPCEILEHYRKMELLRTLHGDEKIVSMMNTTPFEYGRKSNNNDDTRNLAKIYPKGFDFDDVKSKSGLFECPFCKFSGMGAGEDSRVFALNPQAVYTTIRGMRAHLSREHKEFVTVLPIYRNAPQSKLKAMRNRYKNNIMNKPDQS